MDNQSHKAQLDDRERKGAFYTPKIRVELSQRYIADVLGKDWQDEYYVWDCAAGTGNLLAGLTNKYHIWASTIDKADVDVMKDRIHNGANLLEDQVFQFDFLNDDFDKLPKSLRNIINDPILRKKLIVYFRAFSVFLWTCFLEKVMLSFHGLFLLFFITLLQGGKKNAAAEKWKVGRSTIANFKKQRRETGCIEPRKGTPGPRAKLRDHYDLLRQIVQQTPGATLEEISRTITRRCQHPNRPRSVTSIEVGL